MSLRILIVLANIEDPDEMPHHAEFIWVFTVCQSTHLGFTITQRGNQYERPEKALAISPGPLLVAFERYIHM